MGIILPRSSFMTARQEQRWNGCGKGNGHPAIENDLERARRDPQDRKAESLQRRTYLVTALAQCGHIELEDRQVKAFRSLFPVGHGRGLACIAECLMRRTLPVIQAPAQSTGISRAV